MSQTIASQLSEQDPASYPPPPLMVAAISSLVCSENNAITLSRVLALDHLPGGEATFKQAVSGSLHPRARNVWKYQSESCGASARVGLDVFQDFMNQAHVRNPALSGSE